MVGHESVDPKPQGKPGLVTGVTSFKNASSSSSSRKKYEAPTSRGERESGPDSRTELRLRPYVTTRRLYGRGNATQTGEAAENPGKSFLFCLRDRHPGIPSRGERVADTAVKGHPEERRVSAASVVVFGWPLKIRLEGYVIGCSRSLVPISASGLQGEQPLVDRRM